MTEKEKTRRKKEIKKERKKERRNKLTIEERRGRKEVTESERMT